MNEIDARARQLIDDITGRGHKKAEALISTLSEQERNKIDIVAPTDTMEMRAVKIDEQDSESGKILKLSFDEQRVGQPIIQHSMALTDWGHRQLAEKTGIPIRYYDRMREDAPPELVAANVNTWIDNREKRFIRTLDGNVRAILSDKYLVLDHLSAIDAAASKAKELGAVMAEAHLDETRLYVKMIVPHETWQIKQGDHHVRGIMFSNSEVGAGSFRAEPFVMRLICSNGLIGMDKLSRVHLGSKMDAGMYVSSETENLEKETIASKLQDLVEGIFDREKFDNWMESYRQTTEVNLRSPVDATKNVINTFKLGEKHESALLNSLVAEGDSTQYGLINALTSYAKKQAPLVQIEIEKVAGEISVMEEKKFQDTINVEPMIAVA